MRNLEELNGIRKGEPCFIIGAGPSVICVDLDLIKDVGFTIAVNSGYVAMETDYFLSDDWSVAFWSYFSKELVKSPRTLALLYEEKLGNTSKQFGDRAVLFRHRKGYHLTTPYFHEKEEHHLCQARVSTGTAIHAAYVMGADPIVLIGADCRRLDGLRYFWELPEFQGEKPTYEDYAHRRRYIKKNLGGFQVDHDLVEIHKYWFEVSESFKEAGCTVLNASPLSILRQFPIVKIEDVIG